MSRIERLEWKVLRPVQPGCYEWFFVIAQKIAGVWKFSERSTWDVCWEEVPRIRALTADLRREWVNRRYAAAREAVPACGSQRPSQAENARDPSATREAEQFAFHEDSPKAAVAGVPCVPGTSTPSFSVPSQSV